MRRSQKHQRELTETAKKGLPEVRARKTMFVGPPEGRVGDSVERTLVKDLRKRNRGEATEATPGHVSQRLPTATSLVYELSEAGIVAPDLEKTRRAAAGGRGSGGRCDGHGSDVPSNPPDLWGNGRSRRARRWHAACRFEPGVRDRREELGPGAGPQGARGGGAGAGSRPCGRGDREAWAEATNASADSHLTTLVMHLLKAEYQTERSPGGAGPVRSRAAARISYAWSPKARVSIPWRAARSTGAL